jgi:hypothetical protein
MNQTSEQETTRPKQKRTYRKRTRFRGLPRPAIAVRGLWEQATHEEKQRAHTQCMAILEYWLGKASKQEIAGRLEVAPLRVWQMSQQALSGMLAGLLRQPKRRAKVALPPASPEEDPRLLSKKIRELEKKLACTEDLMRVLRDLPWNAATARSTPATSAKEKRDGGRKQASRAKTPKAAPHRGARGSSRTQAGDRQEAESGSAAVRARTDRTSDAAQQAHAAQLEGTREGV